MLLHHLILFQLYQSPPRYVNCQSSLIDYKNKIKFNNKNKKTHEKFHLLYLFHQHVMYEIFEVLCQVLDNNFLNHLLIATRVVSYSIFFYNIYHQYFYKLVCLIFYLEYQFVQQVYSFFPITKTNHSSI